MIKNEKNSSYWVGISKTLSMQNSTDEIYRHLLTEYNKRTMEVEMAMYKARQTRLDGKIQRYFNSTPLKNAFCRWMVYAVYDKRFYTISELVDDMKSNRQSISDMVKDCEAEGWIDVIRKGNSVKCRASEPLMVSTIEYCKWRKAVTKSIIGDAFKSLSSFEQLMQTELAVK